MESVVGDNDQLGKLQAAELDAEVLIDLLTIIFYGFLRKFILQWPDVESLIKEMEMVEGIQSVTKGRFFLSPGLAPTFQVHILNTESFKNGYFFILSLLTNVSV